MEKTDSGLSTAPGRLDLNRKRVAPEPGIVQSPPDVIEVLWRRKWQVAAIACSAVVVAIVALALIAPKYSTTAVVQLDMHLQQFSSSTESRSDDRWEDADIATQVVIITSRKLIGEVVDQLSLLKNPEFNSAAAADSAGWLGTLTRWLEGDKDVADVNAQREATISRVLSELQVNQQGRATTIGITFSSESPSTASLIASSIANHYLEWQEADRERNRATVLDSLAQTLLSLRQKVIVTQESVANSRGSEDVRGKDSDLSAEEASRLNAQLTDAQAALDDAGARLRVAQQLKKAGSADQTSTWSPSLPGGESDRTLLGQLYVRLAEQEQKISELSTQLGEKHPQFIAAKSELTQIRAQIARETEAVVGRLQQSQQIAQRNRDALGAKLAGLRKQVQSTEQDRVERSALESEAASTQALYEAFFSRSQEFANAALLAQPIARLLSAAPIPTIPSFPQKTLTTFVSAIFGVFLGIFLALFLEARERGLRSGSDVIDFTNAYPLGLLPQLSFLARLRQRPDDYPLKHPASPLSESFRSLLYSIECRNRSTTAGKSIFVTSSVSGEGKTSIAICMARTAARSGVRTLLIDGDFLRPSVRGRLGLVHDRGFGDLLTGSASFPDVLQKDPESDVAVITGGTVPPEGLFRHVRTKRVKAFLGALGQRFQLIVIDSAPIMMSTMMREIAGAADNTVLVARWGRTRRDHVGECVRQIEAAGAYLSGIVISLVHTRDAMYGYGDARRYAGDRQRRFS